MKIIIIFSLERVFCVMLWDRKMARLPIFYEGLSQELIEKAEKELNETPQVKAEALRELKELIEDQDDIFCNMEDKYLLAFLRVKKFDIQKSLNCLRNYTRIHQRYSGIFMNRLPSEFKSLVDRVIIFHSPYRLPDLSYVAGLRLRLFDTNKEKADDIVAYILTWAYLSLEYEAIQIAGVNLILDFSGVTFQQYKSFSSFSLMKFGISALQDTFPARIQGIHFINAPFYAKQFFNVFKLFAKKKLTEKVHLYGNDIENLHKNIPKEYLPPWYGGTMTPMDSKEQARVFFSYEDIIDRKKKYMTKNSLS